MTLYFYIMSFCKTCNQNLSIERFTSEDKIYKTCNDCREKQSIRRKSNNVCETNLEFENIDKDIAKLLYV